MRRGRKEKKGTNNKFLVWLICYLHDSQGYFVVVLALFFFLFPFSPSRFVVLVHIHFAYFNCHHNPNTAESC